MGPRDFAMYACLWFTWLESRAFWRKFISYVPFRSEIFTQNSYAVRHMHNSIMHHFGRTWTSSIPFNIFHTVELLHVVRLTRHSHGKLYIYIFKWKFNICHFSRSIEFPRNGSQRLRWPIQHARRNLRMDLKQRSHFRNTTEKYHHHFRSINNLSLRSNQQKYRCESTKKKKIK